MKLWLIFVVGLLVSVVYPTFMVYIFPIWLGHKILFTGNKPTIDYKTQRKWAAKLKFK